MAHHSSRLSAALAATVVFLVGMGGCSAGIAGPSKADIAAALVRSADFSDLHALGLSDVEVEATAECVAEDIYTSLSSDALAAIAEGAFDKELSEGDYAKLSSSTVDCAKANRDASSN